MVTYKQYVISVSFFEFFEEENLTALQGNKVDVFTPVKYITRLNDRFNAVGVNVWKENSFVKIFEVV
jgi:hypothetical protein